MPDAAEQPLGWAIPSHPAPPTPSTHRAVDSTYPCESICSGLSMLGLDLLLLRFQSAEVHPNQPHPSLRRKARKKVIALNLGPSWILGFRVGSRSNKMDSPKRNAAIHSCKATPSAEETTPKDHTDPCSNSSQKDFWLCYWITTKTTQSHSPHL